MLLDVTVFMIYDNTVLLLDSSIIILCGLSGSGKSTIAKSIVRELLSQYLRGASYSRQAKS